MGVSENRGTSFWGPYKKDPTIWGIILGSPVFGNSLMVGTQARMACRFKDIYKEIILGSPNKEDFIGSRYSLSTSFPKVRPKGS